MDQGIIVVGEVPFLARLVRKEQIYDVQFAMQESEKPGVEHGHIDSRRNNFLNNLIDTLGDGLVISISDIVILRGEQDFRS